MLCIGGGSGQAAILKGLKDIEEIELSALVAMSDDGGSTGILRSQLNIPAMGDLRNVMVNLADREDLMTKIMDYRFDDNSGILSHHALGNIVIAALTKENNDLYKTIVSLSQVLRLKGKVYPCTRQSVTLSALMSDGSVIDGETAIRKSDLKVKEIFFKNEVHSYPEVIKTIMEADYIIIGIGSLYTSIICNLIIGDIKQALRQTKAKVIYYCNCMSEYGETDDYSMQDHVNAIEKHLGDKIVDYVVYADDIIPANILGNYAKEKADVVKIDDSVCHYQIIKRNLLTFDNNVIRHDAKKVKESFEEILKG